MGVLLVMMLQLEVFDLQWRIASSRRRASIEKARKIPGYENRRHKIWSGKDF